MHGNNKRCLLAQARRFRARFTQSAGTVLSEVIPPESFLQRWVEAVGAYRERVYGPFTTLTLFVEQVLGGDGSCQDAVARGLSTRVALKQSECSLSTGPYCKARRRLPLSWVMSLGREVSQRLCTAQPAAWRWRGREVKLIDGTTVSMPDTRANQARFPQNREQKPGLGFPLARLVGIVSLSCGAVLEWAVSACQGKQTGETALLWGLAGHFKPGDVVVADGCYAGYFLIARLVALGVDILMPQHQRRRTDFRLGQRLGPRDHVVIWVRPPRPTWMDEATYETMPTTLTMREVRAGGRTLVTTLTDARAVTKSELAELYRRRWHIELDLRAIKATLKMDVLRCKTPEMVEKEIAVHLLAYNLVRTVMARAAALHHRQPRELSFKSSLQLLNAFEEFLRHHPQLRLAEAHTPLLSAIAQKRLPHRPGRVEPRAVKRRPKHPLLTQSRHLLRQQLYRHQQQFAAARA